MNILLRRRIRSKEKRRLGKKKSKCEMIYYGTGTASQRNPGNFSLRRQNVNIAGKDLWERIRKASRIFHLSLTKVHLLDFNFPTLPS